MCKIWCKRYCENHFHKFYLSQEVSATCMLKYFEIIFHYSSRRNGIQMGFKAILGEAGESLFETLDLIKEYVKYNIIRYSRENTKICVLSCGDKTEQHNTLSPVRNRDAHCVC